MNEDLRQVLLDANRAKSAGARLKALAGIRPQQLLPNIPQNSEPRTGLSMGEHQAVTTIEWGITREAQDELAAASHHNLAASYDRGFQDDLITPFLGLTRDQNLRPDSSVEKLAKLSPAFGKSLRRRGDHDGRQLDAADRRRVDGAARLATSGPPAHKLPVLAYFVDAETAAVDYVHGDRKADGLLMAPAYAVPRLLARNGLTLQDFDFYEIHEAFAVDRAGHARRRGRTRTSARRASAWTRRWVRSTARKLNVNGSSLAAGHPFAATGGRIVASLAKALHEKRLGSRADLDLRRRRPGRRRDPGEVAPRRPCDRPSRRPSRTVSDRYLNLVNSPVGSAVASRVGLPQPAVLRRYAAGDPLLPGPVLLGSTSPQAVRRAAQAPSRPPAPRSSTSPARASRSRPPCSTRDR